MRSLTVRIFLSFWLIIGVMIGLAALAGYAYSERLREALENFEIDDTVLAASSALQAGGRDELLRWLENRPASEPMAVYIIDRDGGDLLGRRLPHPISRMVRRVQSFRNSRRQARDWGRDGPPDNFRRARPFTQLRGPDGALYSLIAVPKQNPWREWIAERAGPAFLLLAILISAVVSYVLARAIARPVQTFREATVAIADGRLDTRVAESIRNRRDEIGMLAHDLDSMAEKLHAASARQTELTRNISHELRSPLARLRVALELARREAGDLPEFARIDLEAERLDEMIGQILSFSRMDASEDEPPSKIVLSELVEEVAENVNYECRSQGIEGVSVELQCRGKPVVNGYASALTSAIENVLRNAIRHSPDNGTVSVDVDVDATDVVIVIVDQGPGASEDDLDRLFEPFYRSADAAQAAHKGSGLGLAIAKRAVQKNAGTISARNADSGGLSVVIRLPQAES